MLKNPEKIYPGQVPPALDTIAQGMRMMGRSKDADELVATMNQAAERAVPEVKGLMLKAVKTMSVEGLAQKYNQFAAQGAQLGLIKGNAATSKPTSPKRPWMVWCR